MTLPPDFEELLGAELDDRDAERLRRVHELLVAAGPPPELSPELRVAPTVLDTRRRRRERTVLWPAGFRYLAAAAAIAAVAFAAGRITHSGDEFKGTRTISMQATSAAPLASATLEIGKSSSHGNWPMRLHARALPALQGKDYYAVFLTRNGRVVGLCGYFHAHGGKAEAYLNAPYGLKNAEWIVTRQHPGQQELGPVVLTTSV